MPAAPGAQLGTRRCAVCGTFIRRGVVCPEHRQGEADPESAESVRRTVEELPLEAMSVPRAYQRELKEHRVRRIIRQFDPDLLGLMVIVRDEESRLWILDGQHRWLALVELGYRTALCEVLHDVPLPRQAQIFSGRNSRRVAPRPRDAFRADYTASDPHVVAIMRTLDRNGYQSPIAAGTASARRFVCVGALRDVHAWGLLTPTVALIRDAWPADEMATQGPVLVGLAATLHLYPHVAPRELALRLARHSADEVLRLARGHHANSRERRLWAHVAAVVVDLYNHGRTAAHRLSDPQIPHDAVRQWREVER